MTTSSSESSTLGLCMCLWSLKALWRIWGLLLASESSKSAWTTLKKPEEKKKSYFLLWNTCNLRRTRLSVVISCLETFSSRKDQEANEAILASSSNQIHKLFTCKRPHWRFYHSWASLVCQPMMTCWFIRKGAAPPCGHTSEVYPLPHTWMCESRVIVWWTCTSPVIYSRTFYYQLQLCIWHNGLTFASPSVINRQQVPERNQKKKKKMKWRAERSASSHRFHCAILWPIWSCLFSSMLKRLKHTHINLDSPWRSSLQRFIPGAQKWRMGRGVDQNSRPLTMPLSYAISTPLCCLSRMIYRP